ncbi:DNA-processing protein DprA [Streptomyces millisiae]|uniref:DNA-processing protein DprA n=1 Tax=Streptomyces millisiae TaxID=3075542 RepID=A0ABU2LUI5_9ACTN|nr:DNA-processing protein DprA [Streptomyces sp. DSM 44918]MDT0321239.1 DNA-processing protein DprA [Streptomyces sp. DSM 44918]
MRGALAAAGPPAGRASGSVSGECRLARAAVTRLAEPGDELMGRWLAELGPEEVWRAVRADDRLPGASRDRWAGLRLRARRADPSRDLAAIAAAGGRFLCPGDREWPSQLDDLGPARPVGLWVRGPCSLRFVALRSVAVVGSRACTDYGAHVAAEFAGALAERGWAVVSGAAYGVDGAAHRGALAVGGPTVAVLACGVDVGYPAAHRELLDRIAGGGLLVAELPPGEHPTRARFVQRNRVIAALTRGTVVVEAARRSGSLVTARHASRLGRHLMAVPGPVTSSLSVGAHRLIREAAVLVSDVAEIIELVGDMGELPPEEASPAVPRELLAPEAGQVLEALPAWGALGVEEIARRACTGEAAALARLRELSCLGFVERVGERWQLPCPAGRHAGGGDQAGSAGV